MRWPAAIAVCACHGGPPVSGAPPPLPPLVGFVHHDEMPALGDFRSVWRTAADDVWAVDGHGTAMHWDGRGWRIVYGGERLRDVPMRAVWASGRDDVWLVAGSPGDTPPMRGDYEIHVPAEAEVWRGSGTTWAPVTLPALGDRTLGQLHGSGPDDVWISVQASGGDDRRRRDEHASALHWDGTHLVESTFADGDSTTSPWVSSPRDAWIVTRGGHAHGSVWHWDGFQWSREPEIERADAVWVDAGTVWVVTEDAVYHRRAAGGPWQIEVGSEGVGRIHATPTVWGRTREATVVWQRDHWETVAVPAGLQVQAAGGPADDPWLFGTRDRRYTAVHGTRALSGPIAGGIFRMAFATPDDGWAIARLTDDNAKGRQANVYRWLGGTWQEIATPPPFFPTAVWAMPGRAWIAGTHGELALGDGAHWQVMPSLGLAELTSFWGTQDDLWAGGCGGSVAHWDGTAWHPVPIDALAHGFQGVCVRLAGTSARDVWAIAPEIETIYHWDGTAWTATKPGLFDEPGGFGDRLAAWAIEAASPSDVWVIGGGGRQNAQPLLLHYDGTTWQRTLLPPAEQHRHHPRPPERERWQPWPDHTMYGAWARAANDIWAAGGGGEVLHYDGTCWSRIAATPGDHRDLLVVAGAPGGPVWFGGERGELISFAPGGSYTPVVTEKVCGGPASP